jgi:hypothetical protein
MPNPTPQELKKLLIAEGLEIYRTLADRVVIADRVRDNLIMDSGVAALSRDDGLAIRVVFRAQSSDFQGETPDGLLGHARRLAQHSTSAGYAEVSADEVPIHDPGDRSHVLDTWYEVSFERSVADTAELVTELKAALGWAKVAARGGP